MKTLLIEVQGGAVVGVYETGYGIGRPHVVVVDLDAASCGESSPCSSMPIQPIDNASDVGRALLAAHTDFAKLHQ